jgi:hypothetical protein
VIHGALVRAGCGMLPTPPVWLATGPMRLSNQLSNDPSGHEGTAVDVGGRLRQGQVLTAAG